MESGVIARRAKTQMRMKMYSGIEVPIIAASGVVSGAKAPSSLKERSVEESECSAVLHNSCEEEMRRRQMHHVGCAAAWGPGVGLVSSCGADRRCQVRGFRLVTRLHHATVILSPLVGVFKPSMTYALYQLIIIYVHQSLLFLIVNILITFPPNAWSVRITDVNLFRPSRHVRILVTVAHPILS